MAAGVPSLDAGIFLSLFKEMLSSVLAQKLHYRKLTQKQREVSAQRQGQSIEK